MASLTRKSAGRRYSPYTPYSGLILYPNLESRIPSCSIHSTLNHKHSSINGRNASINGHNSCINGSFPRPCTGRGVVRRPRGAIRGGRVARVRVRVLCRRLQSRYPVTAPHHTTGYLRTTTSHKCAAVPRRARIQGSLNAQNLTLNQERAGQRQVDPGHG